MLENFFNPTSVAVIGASQDPKKVGFALVSNLIKGRERKIYAVTLSGSEILGLPTFKSILDVPADIDLAIVAVKAEQVAQILIECGQKKITNAIVVSSGFKEMGSAGKKLEEEVTRIAKENNITLLGPNCLGVIDIYNDLNASFSGKKPLAGNIAFLSQSGALGTAMIDWAIGEGIGFSKFISLGNEAGLTEIDFLKYLENDESTRAIIMYLENINDGPAFLETVKRITPKKLVVIIKAGMGGHGSLAVMSHTGALAPQPAVFIAACKQAGAVTVSSLRGFFNVVKILSQTKNANIPVQRLIILTNGGGPSVIAADLIDRSHSLSLLELSGDVKEKLREALPKMAAIGNPIDIIGDALAERYDKALSILCEVPEADGIVVILTPQMMTEAEETARVLAKYKDHKRIFPIFIGGPAIEAGRQELIKLGLTHFTFARNVIDALDYMARGAPKLKSITHHGENVTATAGEMMSFENMKKVFSEYNISIEGKFIKNKEDLANTLQNLGDGPYVMKAISSNIVHKTETGAVRLNISNLDEANMIWEELWQKFVHLEGILIQKMVGGTREIIIGMKRDNTFGPTIVFGLGGILAEAIKDTSIRIAPFEKPEALKMMQEIKGLKILQGMRGQSPVNFEMLADIIVSLSRLAVAHPEIKEIDLNPVLATDTMVTIVDARIML